jgi:hypothetical protein
MCFADFYIRERCTLTIAPADANEVDTDHPPPALPDR